MQKVKLKKEKIVKKKKKKDLTRLKGGRMLH